MKRLAREYLAMVGMGRMSQNPVLLCQALTSDFNFSWLELPADYFEESAIRLALGYNVDVFLAEVLGYHLASSKEEVVWRAISKRCIAAGLADHIFRRILLARSAMMNASMVSNILRPHQCDASSLLPHVKAGMALNKSINFIVRVLEENSITCSLHSQLGKYSIEKFPNLKSLTGKLPGSGDDETVWSHELYTLAAPGCHFTRAGLRAVGILSELSV